MTFEVVALRADAAAVSGDMTWKRVSRLARGSAISTAPMSAVDVSFESAPRLNAEYVADFRAFLEQGTFLERKALIRNFVEGIEVVGDETTLTYTSPMPSDGRTREGASVLEVQADAVEDAKEL